MTLITGFVKDKSPALIGDVLITNESSSVDSSITLPGKGQPIQDQSVGLMPYRKPTGLYQKVVLITDYLAFAWSDSYLTARMLLEELPPHSKSFNLEEWRHFYDELLSILKDEWRTKSGADFSCILLVCADKYSNFIPFNMESEERAGCSTFYSSGTGANWAKEVFSGNVFENGSSNPSPLSQKIVGELACLWASDLNDQANITESVFGGGYEAVVLDAEGLRKIDDYILIYAQIKQRSATEFGVSIMKKIAKFDYVDNLLIIRTYDLLFGSSIEKNRVNSIPVVGSSVTFNQYVVGPPGVNDKNIEESKIPDMNGTLLGLRVDCFFTNGQRKGFNFSCSSESRKLPVWFEGEYIYITPELGGHIDDGFERLLKSDPELIS